ncbi:MAG: hypothetical protein ACLQVK_11320 [Acidimicrobiales bacterium]
MDLQQLKQCLLAAGVAEGEYLLIGLDPPRAVREGACIVRPNQRSWEVLVWRPVRLEPSLTFLSEDEACEYALDVLTSAITRSEGTAPAGPVAAGRRPVASAHAHSGRASSDRASSDRASSGRASSGRASSGRARSSAP